MEYFLATGNLISKHGLGILQVLKFVFNVFFYKFKFSKQTKEV